MIKENEFLARSGWWSLKLKQGSKLSLAIYSLCTGLGKLRAAVGASAVAAEGVAATAAATNVTLAQQGIWLSTVKDFADIGKLSDYYEFFTGNKDVSALWQELMKAAAAYQKQAHAFNNDFAEWANGRQNDLDRAYREMNEEIKSSTAKLKDNLRKCHGEEAGEEVEVPEREIGGFQIPVLKAWTDLGYGWTAFGYAWGRVSG
jgi:hypothetical protein